MPLWILKPKKDLPEDLQYWDHQSDYDSIRDVDEVLVSADTEEGARQKANSAIRSSYRWEVPTHVVGIKCERSASDVWLHPHLTTCEKVGDEISGVWARADAS